MIRQFATAVVLAAALTLIGTPVAANDYRWHPDKQMRLVVESGRPDFILVGYRGGHRDSRHGYRHSIRRGYRHPVRYGHYRAYPVYRWRTNFYGPSTNFYDQDPSYSYREEWYPGDRPYRYGRPGLYRSRGGVYRQHSYDGRRPGRHR